MMEKARNFAHSIPLWLAQDLIRASAYWMRSDGIVSAPRHAENVREGPYGWEVAFGANKVLIERAARSCYEYLSKNYDDVDDVTPEAKQIMSKFITLSVSNYVDETYDSPYPVVDGYMIFGVQAIHIGEFIEAVLGALL